MEEVRPFENSSENFPRDVLGGPAATAVNFAPAVNHSNLILFDDYTNNGGNTVELSQYTANNNQK